MPPCPAYGVFESNCGVAGAQKPLYTYLEGEYNSTKSGGESLHPALNVEMTEVTTTDSAPTLENMEALLRESEQMRAIRSGDLVQGVIMSVDRDSILVGIGNKSEGIVPAKEMRTLSEEELASLKVGDEILTSVMEAEREDGAAILSVDRAREEMSWLSVADKLDSGEAVTGTITGFNRGGALVDVFRPQGLRAHVPPGLGAQRLRRRRRRRPRGREHPAQGDRG